MIHLKSIEQNYLKANTNLTQLVKHWTLKPLIVSCIRSSHTGGNFFALVVKSLDANTAISANFVLIVKNSIRIILEVFL